MKHDVTDNYRITSGLKIETDIINSITANLNVLFVCLMLFNPIFNNISVISWR